MTLGLDIRGDINPLDSSSPAFTNRYIASSFYANVCSLR